MRFKSDLLIRLLLPCSILSTLSAPGSADPASPASRFDPGPGKTLLLVGQTFTREFQDYVKGMGRAPAGSAHYGELYRGAINQGDDGQDLSHLRAVEGEFPCAYANIAISWKDNPDLSDYPADACGGFTGHRIYKVNRDIAASRYDAAIDSFAAVMKAYPGMRFLVRIEYEVGQYLFTWKDPSSCPGGGQSLDFSDSSKFDPSAYRRAYNHIAHRLRNINGVANAAFVYHPVRGFEDAVSLYPGPEFVDYVALSLFNHDLCVGASWCGAKDSLDGNVRKVFDWAKAAGKPLMVAESAPQPPATSSEAGFKDWLARLLGAVEGYDVRVLSYINSDWVSHGWTPSYWGDSRVETRPGIKSYWTSRVLDNPRYVQYGCGNPWVGIRSGPARRGHLGATWRLLPDGRHRIDGRREGHRVNVRAAAGRIREAE